MNILTMAFVLACEITIGQYRFTRVNEVRIEKSWRELADKCEIRLPKNVRTEGLETNTLEKYIKVGDQVSVKLWYDGLESHEEFNGYVRRLKPTFPFEIECEDHIYFLRKTPIKKSWAASEKATLKVVVKYIVDQVNSLYPDANIQLSSKLPDVTFSEGLVIEASNTAATALEKIKDNFGLVSYLKGRELFTGLAYQNDFGSVKHSLAWNIIVNDLKYRNEDDVRIKIKAIGITQANKKITIDDGAGLSNKKGVIGDADGEQRTLYFYNVTSEDELRKLALEELKKLKYTGYEGTVDTFLYPYCEPLMKSDLRDPEYGESRSGKYIIDSVKTQFGAYGARRTIELGVKVTA